MLSQKYLHPQLIIGRKLVSLGYLLSILAMVFHTVPPPSPSPLCSTPFLRASGLQCLLGPITHLIPLQNGDRHDGGRETLPVSLLGWGLGNKRIICKCD